VGELEWRIRQAREALGGLDLVTCDYFQLIALGKAENGYEGRTRNAQKLAALAVRENVPLLVGCQLNRGAETDDKADRPTRAELEGTGRLEQVASGVILLHRWNRRAREEFTPGEIIVDKNQDGRLGIVEAGYYGPCARWQ
jgi:replicative DNA helicase